VKFDIPRGSFDWKWSALFSDIVSPYARAIKTVAASSIALSVALTLPVVMLLTRWGIIVQHLPFLASPYYFIPLGVLSLTAFLGFFYTVFGNIAKLMQPVDMDQLRKLSRFIDEEG